MRRPRKSSKRPRTSREIAEPPSSSQGRRLLGLILIAVSLVIAALVIQHRTTGRQKPLTTSLGEVSLGEASLGEASLGEASLGEVPPLKDARSHPLQKCYPPVVIEGPAYEADAAIEDLRREARQTAQTLVDEHPDSPDVWHVLARLQVTLGDTEESIAAWEACIQRDPDRADAYLALADLRRKHGEFQDASRLYRKVLSLVPDHRLASTMLADVLMKQGQIEEAVGLLEPLANRTPVLDRTLLCLGQAYLQLKEYDKARDTLERLVALDPEESAAHYALSRAYTRLGLKDESRAHREQFTRLSKSSREIQKTSREYDDEQVVRGLLVDTLVKAGYVYQDQQQWDKAETMWCKAAYLDLTNARSRNQLLGLYERQGRNREALRTAEELIGIDPENGNYWLIVGELNRRLGRKVQARDAVERALRIDPDNPRYHEVYQLVQEGD